MDIKNFIEKNRQTGTTTQLIKLIRSNHGYLIVANQGRKELLLKDNPDLVNNIITVHDIKNDKCVGLDAKPIFFDTDAICVIINTCKSAPENTVSYVEVDSSFAKGNRPTFADIEAWKEVFEDAAKDKDFFVITHNNRQLNVKLTDDDTADIAAINKKFFEDEASNSMLGRILIRKGIQFYKNFK